MKKKRCWDSSHYQAPQPKNHEIKDRNGKRYSVLSFLFLGTLYHQAVIVSTKGGQVSSKLCFQMFNDKWAQHMGLPESH